MSLLVALHNDAEGNEREKKTFPASIAPLTGCVHNSVACLLQYHISWSIALPDFDFAFCLPLLNQLDR